MEGQVGTTFLRQLCHQLVLHGLLTVSIAAQGHDWWANNVQWDGVTHWSEYIIYSPRFMGPNALPVPTLTTGRVDNSFSLFVSGVAHLSQGDKTYNPLLRVNYALVPDRISFDLSYVPYEYFEVSHAKKTERNVFHTFYDRTSARGDVYLNTSVQLLKSEAHGLAIRLGYKFPTSTLQGAARFTNSPGYHLDLSYGRQWWSGTTEFAWSAMFGFYAWQTNADEQFQNDALLLGMGMAIHRPTWQITQGIRGYLGYLDIGDQPVVSRTELSYDLGPWTVLTALQFGLQDMPFTSIEVGLGRAVRTDRPSGQ